MFKFLKKDKNKTNLVPPENTAVNSTAPSEANRATSMHTTVTIPPPTPIHPTEDAPKKNWFKRLSSGLKKTRGQLGDGIATLAKTHGFTITSDEVYAHQDFLGQDGDLTDFELELISGGQHSGSTS